MIIGPSDHWHPASVDCSIPARSGRMITDFEVGVGAPEAPESSTL
jgi:hypothetical protein